MSGATHLRGIAIAGALAALALAGAFLTFSMNQDASKAATPPTILPLKDRHTAGMKVTPKVTPATTVAAMAKAKPKPKPKPKPVDPNYKAALAAGLPATIAQGFAQSPVVVVELSSTEDTVSEQATAEAKAGAQLGGAAFVSVDVDKDSGTVQTLARVLDQVPDAPAALIYTRPATLSLTLTGYVDQTVIQQAVLNADPTLASPAAQAQVDGSWASQANGYCKAWADQTTAIDLKSDTQTITRSEGTATEAASQQLVTSIKALTPPPGGAADVKQLDALFDQALVNQRAVVNDEIAHNKKAFAVDYAKEQKIGEQRTTLERKLGATACVGAE